MARVRTTGKKDADLRVGRREGNHVHLNVRIPEGWLTVLTEVLDEKKTQHGTYRMTDLIRENIYLTFIKPMEL